MKTPSSTPAPKGEKKRLSQHLDSFLRKNRVLLFVVFGVILAVVVALAAYSIIDSSLANSSAVKIEQLSDDFNAWASNQDKAKKDEAGKALKSQLEALTKKYPGQFASVRAYSFLAKMAIDAKDYAAAEQNWMAIYKGFPKTYVAPIALQNAAVAAEERGAVDVAIADLKLVLDKYSNKTVGLPHVYFSLARLAEGAKDYAQAMTYYEKLASTYPDDDWTKLAKDRIILLKAQGLTK